MAKAQQAYFATHDAAEDVDARNQAQHGLNARYTPFFLALHASLKQLDKAIRELDKRKAEVAKAAGKRMTANRQTKGLKEAVQALHDEVTQAEGFFAHIEWLQQRFPGAAYEDVTRLCKLAARAEIEAQDWSLNPGRYVGVVIEQDGKTEEEFMEYMAIALEEPIVLSESANAMEAAVYANLRMLLSES